MLWHENLGRVSLVAHTRMEVESRPPAHAASHAASRKRSRSASNDGLHAEAHAAAQTQALAHAEAEHAAAAPAAHRAALTDDDPRAELLPSGAIAAAATSLVGYEVSLLTEADALKIAVVEVTSAATSERGEPKRGGLSDARMGTLTRGLACSWCNCEGAACTGHYGYVRLATPVLRWGYIPHALLLLRTVCGTCSRRRFTTDAAADGPRFIDVSAAVAGLAGRRGLARLRAISEACKGRLGCCPWDAATVARVGGNDDAFFGACGAPQPQYGRKAGLFIERTWRPAEMALFADADEAAAATAYFTPADVRSIFHHVPHGHLADLGFDPSRSHPEDFVATIQMVSPPCTRPPPAVQAAGASRAGGAHGEHDRTVALQELVRANDGAAKAKAAAAAAASENKSARAVRDARAAFHVAAAKLQQAHAAIVTAAVKRSVHIEGGASPAAAAFAASRKSTSGDVKSTLNGKQGLLRKDMTGFRVDYGARTVIGPDTFADIFELGVPAHVMRTLTYPQPVTNLNGGDLAARVRRGADVDDGAVCVIVGAHAAAAAAGGGGGRRGDTRTYNLAMMSAAARDALAAALTPGDVVERMLRNGDAVLFNRQPTLHRGSIQAHLVYRLPPGVDVFRLNLAVTNNYNADYDGGAWQASHDARAKRDANVYPRPFPSQTK